MVKKALTHRILAPDLVRMGREMAVCPISYIAQKLPVLSDLWQATHGLFHGHV
jgi:hypothetical protein